MTGEQVASSQTNEVTERIHGLPQAVSRSSNPFIAIASFTDKERRTIQRYLEQYAEPQSHQRLALPQATYQHVLVIPAFDEPVGCLEQVIPATLSDTLVIVVANAAEDSDRPSIQRTQQFLQSLRSLVGIDEMDVSADADVDADAFTIIPLAHHTTLVVVDCCTKGRQLPAKQGVGLARKIGGDIALAYIAQGTVKTVWIHYTDADVVLPDDFFEARIQGGKNSELLPGPTHTPPQPSLRPPDTLRENQGEGVPEVSPYVLRTGSAKIKGGLRGVSARSDERQNDHKQHNEKQNVNQQSPMPQQDVAVMLYPFRHQPVHGEILRYEISLRYYVTQLAKARSPYAFHTIGSLMCVNGLHYAKVRGFPKRKAAEDFYMLNKLAKTGAVLQLQAPVVTLDSRLSHRVPFGTGAMMTKLQDVQSMASQANSSPASSPLMFYQPAVFQALREWLECIDALWPPIDSSLGANPLDKGAPDHMAGQPMQYPSHNLKSWFTNSPWQGAPWIECLLEMGLGKTLQQAYRQSRDRHHFQRYMWTWFDAFRTLKLVHYLRDHHYPSLTVSQLWQALTGSQVLSYDEGEGNDVPLNTADQRKLELLRLQHMNQWLCELEATLPPIVGPTL